MCGDMPHLASALAARWSRRSRASAARPAESPAASIAMLTMAAPCHIQVTLVKICKKMGLLFAAFYRMVGSLQHGFIHRIHPKSYVVVPFQLNHLLP